MNSVRKLYIDENKEQLLLKVMKNFEGMNKLDVFDMLQKIEVLLFYVSSPITKLSIKSVIEADLDQKKDVNPFHFTILPNGKFCKHVGANDWLSIYKEQKKGLFSYKLFDAYYFKTVYSPLKIHKLTNKNLKRSLAGTPKENSIKLFLSFTHCRKRRKDNGKFYILSE